MKCLALPPQGISIELSNRIRFAPYGKVGDKVFVLGNAKYRHIRSLIFQTIAEAIDYTSNHWAAFHTYTGNGNLAIDNNIAERAVKPVAICSKNLLFLVLIKVEGC